MPIFEFVCETCGKKSELLLRRNDEIPKCSCGSTKMKRLLSTFAVAEGDSSSSTGCADGSCQLPSHSCTSGMCGLH